LIVNREVLSDLSEVVMTLAENSILEGLNMRY
jgi:hypothetical protein